MPTDPNFRLRDAAIRARELAAQRREAEAARDLSYIDVLIELADLAPVLGQAVQTLIAQQDTLARRVRELEGT